MPYKPKKPCRGRFNTCPNTVEANEKYCPSCKPKETMRDNQRKREQYRIYNKTNRDPNVRKWLASKRYKDARKYFLEQNPLCAECIKDKGEYRPGRAVPATVLDHIQPHKGDYSLFWDTSNWQGLCHACHNRKTNSKDGGYGNPIR